MEESKLIAGLQRGDAEACRMLVSVFGPRLLRAALNLGHDRATAEDLVQETLVTAVQKASGFQGRSAVFTWLYGILRHKHLAHCRKSGRVTYQAEIPDGVCGTTATAGDAEERQLLAQAVGRALERLSDEHRHVVLMRYGDGLRLDAIAAALHVSTGTVKSRLHYAIKALRRDLGEALNLFRQ